MTSCSHARLKYGNCTKIVLNINGVLITNISDTKATEPRSLSGNIEFFNIKLHLKTVINKTLPYKQNVKV